MSAHRFSQLNVFSAAPLGGNPLAVVHAAEELSEASMAALARWTNLSETTFLLPRRIETATIGCGSSRRRQSSLSPDIRPSGHATPGLRRAESRAPRNAWCSNAVSALCAYAATVHAWRSPRRPCGAPARSRPRYWAVMLRSARQVLSLKPSWAALAPLKLGVVGPLESEHDAAFEVRAFIGGSGYEDPVTGSLNASLAQWLIDAGLAPPSYVASQGAALQRAGRIHVRKEGDEVWAGGDVVEVVRGELTI